MLALLAAIALAGTHTVGVDAPSVQAAIDGAEPGDTVLVPPGDWLGPIHIDKPLHLVGTGGHILTSGKGHTVVIDAPGVELRDLIIRGSGDDMMGNNACVRTEPSATGAVIRNSEITDCLFGIWIHTTEGVRVLDNLVVGRPDTRNSDKGNGIQLFDATKLEVRGNTVRGARDGIYVAATDFSTIAGNDVSNHRYGIHYMYSYDNEISGNTAHGNTGGIALMGSFRLDVHHNQASENDGVGMLFRDLQDCTIWSNRVERNGEGLFFYSSVDNEVHHNVMLANQSGARIWGGTERNLFWANAFIGNQNALFYVSAYDQEWGHPEHGGNYWSDHTSWDQDKDGFADRPYRADTGIAHLLFRWPQSVLLLNSPALELMREAQARLPALRMPSVVDPRPLARPPEVP